MLFEKSFGTYFDRVALQMRSEISFKEHFGDSLSREQLHVLLDNFNF